MRTRPKHIAAGIAILAAGAYLLWNLYAEYGFHNNKLKVFADLRNITNSRYTEIAGFNGRQVVFKSGEVREMDVIILATGWEMDYGFLEDDLRDALDPRRITGEKL